MAKARSPGYPAIGLKEAIEKVRLVYNSDYQNKVPKAVIAAHMGYKSLSGASLPILAALNQFGLLEGRGEETRVSDRALTIIAHEPGSPERIEAIKAAACAPDLFTELEGRFPKGSASDAAIRSYLLTQRYIPAAADTALRAYRETMTLVASESASYDSSHEREQPAQHMTQSTSILDRPAKDIQPPEAKSPMLKEVFNLDEGPVLLEFPSAISEASYEELKDQLELFLRRQARRARNIGNYESAQRRETDSERRPREDET